MREGHCLIDPFGRYQRSSTLGLALDRCRIQPKSLPCGCCARLRQFYRGIFDHLGCPPALTPLQGDLLHRLTLPKHDGHPDGAQPSVLIKNGTDSNTQALFTFVNPLTGLQHYLTCNNAVCTVFNQSTNPNAGTNVDSPFIVARASPLTPLTGVYYTDAMVLLSSVSLRDCADLGCNSYQDLSTPVANDDTTNYARPMQLTAALGSDGKVIIVLSRNGQLSFVKCLDASCSQT